MNSNGFADWLHERHKDLAIGPSAICEGDTIRPLLSSKTIAAHLTAYNPRVDECELAEACEGQITVKAIDGDLMTLACGSLSFDAPRKYFRKA